MPPVTTSFVLKRTASLVPTTDITPTEIATGSRRTQVDSGLYCLKDWKYWVIRKTKHAREKKTTLTEPLAAVKRRFRNSSRSSSGFGVRRSHATNAANRAAESPNPPMLRAELQPWSGASMIV